MSYAHAYADAVMRRGRVPMEPADFVPDWADRPRKGKFHPGAEHFPLPDSAALATATVQKGLFGEVGDGAFTLPLLGGMLQDSYGLTGRRLAVQANSDLGTLPLYPHANWSRGTASGGGLYPIGVHWVAGPSGPLTPGVYHYSTPHHSMQRLLAGDVSGEVRAALGDPTDGSDTDQFLVLGVKFWQNAFKYNSFSYHVVTMDIGALLQTWRIWARARACTSAPRSGSTRTGSAACWASRRGRRASSRWSRCAGAPRRPPAPPTGARPPALRRRTLEPRGRRTPPGLGRGPPPPGRGSGSGTRSAPGG